MASEPPKASVDLGRVISRGFEALKANFVPFFALALLLAGVPTFFGQYFLFSQVRTMDPAFMLTGGYWIPLVAAWCGTFIGSALLQGMVTRSTILHLGGREPDFAGSAMLALWLLLPIVALSICFGIVILCGLIFLIVPGVIFWCAFVVAVPALVQERRGVFASMGRSWELTSGSRLYVFALGVLIWVLSAIISGIVGTVTGVSMWGRAAMPDPWIAGTSQGIAAGLTALISTVFIAALYVELRETKEGASTDELADVFG